MTISTSRLSRPALRTRAAAPHGATGVAIGHRSAVSDDRWPAIVEALAALRDDGRHSIRIVDADCGTGGLLLRAVCHARSIGFTSIEGRGIDGAPALIARATAAAAHVHDRAIGVTFEMGDLVAALAEEAEVPADIVLCHRMPSACADKGAVARAIAAAGRVVIVDGGRSIGRSIECRA